MLFFCHQVYRGDKSTSYSCGWGDVGCEVSTHSDVSASRECVCDADGCDPTTDAPNAKEAWYECK